MGTEIINLTYFYDNSIIVLNQFLRRKTLTVLNTKRNNSGVAKVVCTYILHQKYIRY